MGEGAAGADVQARPAPVAPAPPVRKRVMTDNATTEALVGILKDNPRGVLRLADEFTAFMGNLDAYRGGKGSDRQFYLSCWSGSPAQVDRKGEAETTLIPNPFLVVFGAIQPDMLSTLEDGRGRDDGFVQRFLFSFPPPQPPSNIRDRPGFPRELQERWALVVDRLFGLAMEEPQDDDPDRTPRPRTLTFTAEAAEAFYDWHTWHWAETEWDCFPSHLRGLWSKFEVHALALILVAHMLRGACSFAIDGGEYKQVDPPIDVESVRRGLLLADYFKDHNVRALNRMKVSQEDTRLERVIAWIRKRPERRATSRQLQQNGVAGIKSAKEARTILANLADRGFGRNDSGYFQAG